MGTYKLLILVNIVFTVLFALYFYNQMKTQKSNKSYMAKDSEKEMEKLQKMREMCLTEPLAEKTRPTSIKDIVGQERGLKSLRAAVCGPNPQHVIIYGPPGVGKTAAARVILEEAKNNPISPFSDEAKFVEIDATTIRFDERGIADPLIGSVHDPIYQGAGAMGVAGVPQPKPGAVTKANGGVLFLDEIGELHSIQMNKLLKVLEDRKVFLESAYFSSEDPKIPSHIKDIFENGLPADFRLIGATTRTPEEIPPAIRSRCVEIFFRPLLAEEIKSIADNAASKGGFKIGDDSVNLIGKYATNGRETVNIIQIAGGIAVNEGRDYIKAEDVEWVIESGQYSPRPEKKIESRPQIGYVNGLAVYGPNMGTIIEVEATVTESKDSSGALVITGIVEEEETGSHYRRVKRKSTSRASVENVLTVTRKYLGLDTNKLDIHINFPGGVPVDGPSAGITIATAVYSAIMKVPVSNEIAMTGEVSIRGYVKPVGGIIAKIEAAKKAGAKRVLIPRDNYQDTFKDYDIEVIPVDKVEEVIQYATSEIVKTTVTDEKILVAESYN
ncbi:MAG: ATP-dependent protease LonB [Clostridium sp.]|uniref:ATP-dependent protease LonB n=1 Tax=Clostridium sp. TaxID=1506 RepID=UPI002FCBB197